jgi:pimeloyl-ACP methyl ester carboxylesterase
VRHFIMHTRRAASGSARPLNCGVRRHRFGLRRRPAGDAAQPKDVINLIVNASSEQVSSRGLWYSTRGNGEPILWIHGAYLPNVLLPLVNQPLLNVFKSIRYHRRGYRGSVAHAGGLSIEQEAQDAQSLLEELSIEKAHVVGYSSGGVVAYHLTRSAPARVHSLCLIEPALQAPAPNEIGMPPFLEEAFALYKAGDTESAVDAFWRVVGNPDWKRSVHAVLPEGVHDMIENARIFFELEAPQVVSYSFNEPDAQRIHQPILHLVSDGLAAATARLRERFHLWLPQTEEMIIHSADHALPLQQPKAIAKAISDFLSRNPIGSADAV